jgi:hypothetical protein
VGKRALAAEAEAEAPPVGAAIYLGAGEVFIGGVPARNLTLEEWDALTPELRRQCLATNVYRLVQPGDPAPDDATEA